MRTNYVDHNVRILLVGPTEGLHAPKDVQVYLRQDGTLLMIGAHQLSIFLSIFILSIHLQVVSYLSERLE